MKNRLGNNKILQQSRYEIAIKCPIGKMKNGLRNNEISEQGMYKIAIKCPMGNNETCGGSYEIT